MEILKRKKILYFVIILIAFVTIRTIGLGNDILNSDGERWHRRSSNFLEALKQGDFKETYQRYHPGVTLMWFNSIVKYFDFKYQLTYTDTPLTLEHVDYFVHIHFLSKAFNVLIISVLFCFQLYLLYKLFNLNTSLLYGTFLSIEPYMIGINRWFHLTSFEVFFSFTSLFFLLYWYKNNKLRYLILSAFLIALAILTKVTSLMIGIVFLIIFISKIIKDKKVNIKPMLIYSLVLAISIFLFFPALWVDPLYVFSKMYGSIFSAVTDNIRSDIISYYMLPFYYFVILLFKLSPLTLIIFIISLWNLRKTKDFNTKIIIYTFVIYYVLLTITEQKIDRYALALFPAIILINSIYLNKLTLKIQNIVVTISVIFLFLMIYVYHPVYSAYYSPLFGGTKKALELGIYDNSGEYFAQAAQYLNTKSRDTYTYVPDGFSSFNLYYKGNSQREYTQDTNYVVKSYDMQRLNITEPNCKKLDKSFGSREYPIVFVWSCN